MEKKYELKNLTFSKYEKKDLGSVINILDFDSENVDIKEIGENVLILYDNKPLLLKIIAFCGIIKRGKHFVRNRNVKVRNQLASIKIW